MRVWLVFILGGIGTYLIRASFIAFGSSVELPGWTRRALRYVGPSVFAAIVAPPILGDGGLAGLARPDARVLAALLAILAAYITRNVTWVLIVGMTALWTLQWIGL